MPVLQNPSGSPALLAWKTRLKVKGVAHVRSTDWRSFIHSSKFVIYSTSVIKGDHLSPLLGRGENKGSVEKQMC